MNFSRRRFCFSVLAITLINYSNGAPTAKQWQALNETVNGRLQPGVPLAKSCYSLFNLTAVVPDLFECTAVQQNYETNAFISGQYGGFMNVNISIPLSYQS